MWLDLRPPRPRRGRSGHDDEEAPDEEEEEKMQIEVSFEIKPERLATLQRVGNGREEPNTNPQLEVRCAPFEGLFVGWWAGLSVRCSSGPNEAGPAWHTQHLASGRDDADTPRAGMARTTAPHLHTVSTLG